MTETVPMPEGPPRRFQFDWVPLALIRPRRAFSRIATQTRGVWLTPLIVLVIAILLRVIISGSVTRATLLNQPPALPPDFEFYSPEQQEQLMQATQTTSGPVFIYIFPAVTSLLGLVAGWLVSSGWLRFVLTLLGSRGSIVRTMNIVAWAYLPFAVRSVLQIIYMLTTSQLIIQPGLSGFAPVGGGALSILLTQLLSLIDIYNIAYVLLLATGIKVGGDLPPARVWSSALLAASVLVFFRVVPASLVALLGGMVAGF